ncbi:hypothetical protein BDF20DRAFT_799547, partial [Mycotypha africana]|uniref:uncharacterized protein n=1 Tax=Mycotypha africana TaxID=64632 RepID=UPI0023003F96
VVGNSRDDNQFRQENVTDDAAVPPCYHLAYFPPRLKESELASDGYEMDFFPPKEFFAHRMWVGAKLRFSLENPLCLNNHAKMTTSLDRTEFNSTGRLGETARLFLTKEVSNDKGWCMSEQRCMVYYPKKPTQSPKGIRYKKQSDFQFTVNPSSIMLFRYSALTFNSHKIHYDYLYSTLEENHPDCLVHGPLSGTLMISKLQQQLALEKKNEAVNDRVVEFEYKCLSPLYVNRPLTVCGKKSASSQADSSSTSVNAHQTRVNKHTKYDLWILNDSGHLAVKGFALIQK